MLLSLSHPNLPLRDLDLQPLGKMDGNWLSMADSQHWEVVRLLMDHLMQVSGLTLRETNYSRDPQPGEFVYLGLGYLVFLIHQSSCNPFATM